MPIKAFLGAAALAAFSALPAAAVPVTWSFEATYSDGVTASGAYDYDADTNSFSNINVETSLGEILSFFNPLSPGNSTFLSFVSDVSGTNGSSYYTADLSLAMTNAGGTIDILPSFRLLGGTGFSFGGECIGTPDCRLIRIDRNLVSGTVSSVPLPAGGVLLITGLAGAVGLKRRKKRIAKS